jgi:hypothetical protein
LSSSFTMPWGEEYTGATLVNMYVAELATHAWDLALATGQLDRLDPSLALPALDGARAMIKPEYRDMVAPGSPFGAEVPPPPGAAAWERLAAFTGRDPRASLAPPAGPSGPSLGDQCPPSNGMLRLMPTISRFLGIVCATARLRPGARMGICPSIGARGQLGTDGPRRTADADRAADVGSHRDGHARRGGC